MNFYGDFRDEICMKYINLKIEIMTKDIVQH